LAWSSNDVALKQGPRQFIRKLKRPEHAGAARPSALRVGTGRVSIRFERPPDGRTSYETFDRGGPLHVIEVPPPQAQDSQGWRDALARWILDHAPGSTAAALRIAIGDDD